MQLIVEISAVQLVELSNDAFQYGRVKKLY